MDIEKARPWLPVVAALLALTALSPICTIKVPMVVPRQPSRPSGITKGSINISYDFFSKTTEAENKDIAYRFSWGSGDTTDWSDWVKSGEGVTMAHTWHSNGTYLVRAQAINRPGGESEWSDALSVLISDNQPPNAPACPAGEVEGDVGVRYEYSTAATDPDGDRVCIRLSWGDGDTSAWTDPVAGGDTVRFLQTWWNAGEYDVIAQARDEAGELSGWSAALRVGISCPASDTVAWKYRADAYSSSPAVAPDGTVYLGAGDLYALKPDGTLKWRYPTGGVVNSSPSVGADGTVYVGSDDRYLYALDADGELKWRCATVSAPRSSPSIGADGTVYIAAGVSGVHAVTPGGTIRWTYRLGATVSSPAIATDGTVYVGSSDSYLYALKPDGGLRWRYQTGGQINSTPALGADGTVYFGSTDYYCYALKPDGTLKWRYQAGAHVSSSPALGADGTVYFGSDDTYLYALNSDGELKWRYATGNWVASSPAVTADGGVCFGCRDGYCYVLDADGALKWRYQTGGVGYASPAVTFTGLILIGSSEYLYALRGESPLASTAWPRYKHDNANSGRSREQ